MPFAHPRKIYAGDYNDDDAAIIVITAGVNQKPLAKRVLTWHGPKERRHFQDNHSPDQRAAQLPGHHFGGQQPVDILTYVTLKLSGMPATRVLGQRHRARLGALQIHPRRAPERPTRATCMRASWAARRFRGRRMVDREHLRHSIHDFCELRGHYDHEAAMKRICRRCEELRIRNHREKACDVLRYRDDGEAYLRRGHCAR